MLAGVAACVSDGLIADHVDPTAHRKHCAVIDKARTQYRDRWVAVARPFFADKVPADVPKRVVYPFAGGDLSTALTVFPDADEITTISLEPAGDPRTLHAMFDRATGPDKVGKSGLRAKPDLKPLGRDFTSALETIRAELTFLYKVNFSNTMNMIDAMRAGRLPTQLVFGLSALEVHGYELVAVRYFNLDDAGSVVYLTDADVAAAPDVERGRAEARNRVFANVEVRFRKPGGRVQIYRHLQVNLDDEHTTKDPRILAHLRAKGPVAAMTKAASYLLSWDSFANIRTYLLEHAVWMVSDATGVPPRFGKAKGFTYETYGMFREPHIGAKTSQRDWRDEWAAQPKRRLAFRFGYYDGSDAHTNHLVIMRKTP